MSKPKTTPSDSSVDINTTIPRQVFIEEKQASNRKNNDDVPKTSNLSKEAHSYVYGLLPSKTMEEFERQMEQSQAVQDSFEDAKQFQKSLSYWSEVPAPSELAERTFAAIQKKIASDTAPCPDSSFPSDPEAI